MKKLNQNQYHHYQQVNDEDVDLLLTLFLFQLVRQKLLTCKNVQSKQTKMLNETKNK